MPLDNRLEMWYALSIESEAHMSVTIIDTDLLNRLVDTIAEQFTYPHDARAQALVARAQEYLDARKFAGAQGAEGAEGATRLVERYLPVRTWIKDALEDDALRAVRDHDDALYGQGVLQDYTVEDDIE